MHRRRLLSLTTTLLASAGCAESTRPIDINEPQRLPTQGTIRAIYVGDTVDRFAIPGQPNIALGVQQNLRDMSTFLRRTANILSMRYESLEVRSELPLSGEPDPFDCTNVMRSLDEAEQRGPADVVFFYYAGHGANRVDPNGRVAANVLGPDGQPVSVRLAAETPFMACTGNSPSPNLANISQRLQATRPRLLVVMFDSCNSVAEFEPFSTEAAAIPAPPTEDLRLAELFLRSRGIVHVIGTQPGQYGFYRPDGGLATKQFLGIIRNADPSQPQTWAQIRDAFETQRVTTYRPGTRELRHFVQQPSMPFVQINRV